jgi:hypothetical protein
MFVPSQLSKPESGYELSVATYHFVHSCHNHFESLNIKAVSILTGQDTGCIAKFLSGPFHSILSFKKYWHFLRKAVHSKIILTRRLIVQLISVIKKINMPRNCCVPNCKSNYASSKSSYVSVFKFSSKKIRMQE